MGLAYNRPAGQMAPTDRAVLWVGGGDVSPIRFYCRHEVRLSSSPPERVGSRSATSMNRRERRALRAIARRLAQEDPSLARRLHRGAPPAPATVLDRIAWTYFAVSITLMVSGLVLDDVNLLRGATLLLAVFPPLILVLAAAFRVTSHDQYVARRLRD